MVENNLDLVGPRIVVIGVGGAGNNAVNRMIDGTDESQPIEFYVMNTDKQTLLGSKVPMSHRIVLGEEITKGLGAGGDPNVGRKAAEASAEEIRAIVRGANLVFIAAGLGGGTGSGAGPVIASICREEKALTIAVVTRPFSTEGKEQITKSIEGFNNMKASVDSIIALSNDRLLIASGSLPISSAFQESDRVLAQSVKTITDLITIPGIINLDFADIRNALHDSGNTLIGYGFGEGANCANDAAMAAISSPLLDSTIKGARRLIISVTCGAKITLYQANDCVHRICEEAGDVVFLKQGISVNDQLSDQMIVSVIATDFPDGFKMEPTVDLVNNNLNQTPNASTNPSKEDNSNNENEDDILPDFLKDKNLE